MVLFMNYRQCFVRNNNDRQKGGGMNKKKEKGLFRASM